MENLCDLIDSDEYLKLQNLKKRYMKDEIYTFASKLLIAVNPFRDLPNLYGSTEMKVYQGKSIHAKPPHIYAMANEALVNISNHLQTIVITGISGSGKTKSTNHIVDYLCNSSRGSLDSKMILNANSILEAFGNAKTTANNNSSRFCRFVELHYDGRSDLVGVHIYHHLLEVSRVCSEKSGGSNFNIFYSLLNGAPNDMKEELCLKNDLFAFLPDSRHRFEMGFYNFEKVDISLKSLGFDQETRTRVYKILATILHLGNIEFEDADSDSSKISSNSQASCDHAAYSLSLDRNELEKSLIARTIKIRESNINVSFNKQAAEKSRDNFVKRLYSYLFTNIVRKINNMTKFKSSKTFIGVLDIAGFERLEHNTFDQFCINYINERMQNFFIRKAILDEKCWYEKEGVEVPHISLFDNTEIVGMFDNTTKGIFALLNDECTLPKSSSEKFTYNVCKTWIGHKSFSAPNCIARNRSQQATESFKIRHFSGDVLYSTTDFVEKNHDKITEFLEKLARDSVGMLGEVNEEKENITSKKNFKSISQSLKYELDSLVEKLTDSTPHFIRCIKPNANMLPHDFEDSIVLEQLRSSSTLSYVDFVQIGFPLRITLVKIQNLYAPYYNMCADARRFHMKLLLSNGLRIGEFKLGNNYIFFRSNKCNQMQQILSVDSSLIALKRYIARTRWLILFMFIMKFFEQASTKNSKERQVMKQHDEKTIDSNTQGIIPANSRSRNVPKRKTDDHIQPATKRLKSEKLTEMVRYDCLSHWPQIDSNKNASRCKNESCTFKTHFYCSKCNVHLCIRQNRNCFMQFHQICE